jgi:hypothetical protein
MPVTVDYGLRQRADYTHKYNLQSGRHGWLRLTPAYSIKIVEELLSAHVRPLRVFDPFAGTATTALCAAYHGHDAVTTDINPFLVWFGQTKTARYGPDELAATLTAAERAREAIEEQSVEPVPAPALHNIGRWWATSALSFLCRLRAAIDAVTDPDSSQRSLLLVAFCQTLIKLSNAAFDHQSMSFTDVARRSSFDDVELAEAFHHDVRFVLRGAAENPGGGAHVLLGDARNPGALVEGSFDLVITSPPYANRMSYIRELRPYMYWLGYLEEGREAGELDWSAIGGTWGVATSRLADWQGGEGRFTNDRLQDLVERIAHEANKSGRVLANYVAKYFDDVWNHLRNLRPLLAPGAEMHYVVGNSTFYGVLLPVERFYAEMFERLGFADVTCRPIRKRNSKKELVEFDVSARWSS